MEKIIKDRINHLKSQFKELSSGKMDRRDDTNMRLILATRISELEWVLAKSDRIKQPRKED